MNSTPQPLARQAGGVSVWHAETLDVDGLLETYGRRVAEGVLWLGHCVYVGLADDARCRDTGRMPLMAQYLHNVIGRRHVDAVRQAALEVGYVTRDRSYRAGDYSQAYWILPPYDRARLVRRQITHGGMRHKIEKWREERRRAVWQRIDSKDSLVDATVCRRCWQNLQRVQVDAEIDFGEGFHPAYQVAVEHIQQGELWFRVDDFGRIHTNLTSLPKSLRQHLSVDGKRLVNVDISESQPLFMGFALAGVESGGQTNRKTTSNQGTRQGGEALPPLPPLMFANTMFDTRTYLWGELDRERLSSDFLRYLKLCESRGLYQAVADRLEKTRDVVKKRIMAVFFGRPWHRNAVSGVLDELFPTVMDTMRRIKRPDYRRLAHFAQRIESAFMFGQVVPRIMELRPDLFLSTIHDSILTTTGDGEFVRQVMRDEFAKLGLSPQVQVEPCSG